eukprot:scaffold32261_cov61-Phaeocystis_antarctica.AAC.7
MGSAWAVHGQCMGSAWTLHAQRHMRPVALLLLPLRALPRELLPRGAELGGGAAQLELGRLLLLLERLALVRLGARRARRLVALAPRLVHLLLEVLAAAAALLLLPLQRRRLALERLELGGRLGRRLPRRVVHAAELGLRLLDAARQRVALAAQLGVRVLGLGLTRDGRVEVALELQHELRVVRVGRLLLLGLLRGHLQLALHPLEVAAQLALLRLHPPELLLILLELLPLAGLHLPDAHLLLLAVLCVLLDEHLPLLRLPLLRILQLELARVHFATQPLVVQLRLLLLPHSLLALGPVVGPDVLEVLEARLVLRLVPLQALVQLRVERRQLAPVGLARALRLVADAQERLLVGRLPTLALLLQLGVVALRGLERAVALLRLLPRRVALAPDGLQLLLEAALVAAGLRLRRQQLVLELGGLLVEQAVRLLEPLAVVLLLLDPVDVAAERREEPAVVRRVLLQVLDHPHALLVRVLEVLLHVDDALHQRLVVVQHPSGLPHRGAHVKRLRPRGAWGG